MNGLFAALRFLTIVPLPGGWGTLEEIFEMLTWAQLGFHEKPCGLLNIEGYYDGLIGFLENSFEQRFVKEFYRPLLMKADNPAVLLDQFSAYKAPKVRKWMGEGLAWAKGKTVAFSRDGGDLISVIIPNRF